MPLAVIVGVVGRPRLPLRRAGQADAVLVIKRGPTARPFWLASRLKVTTASAVGSEISRRAIDIPQSQDTGQGRIQRPSLTANTGLLRAAWRASRLSGAVSPQPLPPRPS